MYLLVAIRYHLVPVARRILKRASVRTFAAYIPIVALLGFGYWRYGAAVQQLPDVPLTMPMARLGTLLGLAPILFIRTPVTRGASIFHSMATEDPTMALKMMILSNVGSRCGYVLLLVLGVAPFVVRLSHSLEQSILHLVSDGVYVVIYCGAVTLIDCASTGRTKYRVPLVLCVLSLVGIETLLLFYRPWADVAGVVLNVTVVGICWTRYIPRMDPILIQEYLNGLAVINDRRRSRLRGILDAVGVETKVYLKSFLLTTNSVIPVIAALAIYGGLLVFLIRGTPQEEPLSSVMVLGFGASFFYSNILIESFRNFNLMFVKMSPVTFFRLTRLILTPHCTIVGLSTAVISLDTGITGFLGRNGSGKTTTMRLIMGLLRPDAGKVLIDDRDLWQFDHIFALKKNLGYLPNEDYFFDRLSGRENLEYLSLMKTADRDAYIALDHFMTRLEVDTYIDDEFGSYSTGMRKKVQFIGALIGDPAHILLDEPHSGLDVLAGIALQDTLIELRSRGAAIFMSSHVPEVFDTLTDRLLVIDRGRIVVQHDAPYPAKSVDLYLRAISAPPAPAPSVDGAC